MSMKLGISHEGSPINRQKRQSWPIGGRFFSVSADSEKLVIL